MQVRTIQVTANDGNGGTTVQSIAVTVTNVNEAPVVTVPAAAQPVIVNINKAITRISVADVDLGASQIQVTVGAANGILTLNVKTGLTFTVGNGTANSTMSFRGTLANVNAALASLVYRTNINYFGPDTITITANDLGSTGAGGAK